MAELSIPKTCKAGVMYDEGPDFYVKVEQVPVPEPGPGEVLLRMNITGICFSDIHYMMNDIALPKMSVCNVRSPGHEGAGVVVKLGEGVTNVQVGDRGGVKPLWTTCGTCTLCLGGQETHCRKGLFTGLHCPGTYQHYIVHPARYLSRIPDGVPDELAAPIMCSASTMVQSLEASGLKPGDWAAFPGGGGGVGIQGIQLAKAMGIRPIAIDTGSEKRDLCLEMGAEVFIDFRTVESAAEEVVKAADGEGAHGVFVTAPQAYRDAIACVGTRVGAKVMCIGLPPADTVMLGADPAKYVLQNFTISGTVVGSLMDTEKALAFANRVRYRPDPKGIRHQTPDIITDLLPKKGLLKPIWEKFSIDRLPEAVAKLRSGKVAGRCIVDFNM